MKKRYYVYSIYITLNSSMYFPRASSLQLRTSHLAKHSAAPASSPALVGIFSTYPRFEFAYPESQIN